MFLGGVSFEEFRRMPEAAGRELLERMWDLRTQQRKDEMEFSVAIATAMTKAITGALSQLALAQARALNAAMSFR